MKTHSETGSKSQAQSSADSVSGKKQSGSGTFQFTDNRPEMVFQRKVQELADQKVSATPPLPGNGTVQLGKKKQLGKTAKATRAATKAASSARVAGFGGNWAVLAWRTYVKNHGMTVAPGAGQSTGTGKIIFTLTNGHEIVNDLAGYWRHYDGVNYYDRNNVVSTVLQDTHFWNSSGAKARNS